jgi:hypothetical protein
MKSPIFSSSEEKWSPVFLISLEEHQKSAQIITWPTHFQILTILQSFCSYLRILVNIERKWWWRVKVCQSSRDLLLNPDIVTAHFRILLIANPIDLKTGDASGNCLYKRDDWLFSDVCFVLFIRRLTISYRFHQKKMGFMSTSVQTAVMTLFSIFAFHNFPAVAEQDLCESAV